MNLDLDKDAQPFPTIQGRWVVLGMIGFGLVMTGIIWGYWKLRLAPFLPLQKAILREFPGSYPRIEGGRPKKQPPLLRMVVQVDFTPQEGDERVDKIAARITELTRENLDLSEYEDFELHLVHYIPEKTPERLTIRRKVSDLQQEPSPAFR